MLTLEDLDYFMFEDDLFKIKLKNNNEHYLIGHDYEEKEFYIYNEDIREDEYFDKELTAACKEYLSQFPKAPDEEEITINGEDFSCSFDDLKAAMEYTTKEAFGLKVGNSIHINCDEIILRSGVLAVTINNQMQIGSLESIVINGITFVKEVEE